MTVFDGLYAGLYSVIGLITAIIVIHKDSHLNSTLYKDVEIGVIGLLLAVGWPGVWVAVAAYWLWKLVFSKLFAGLGFLLRR